MQDPPSEQPPPARPSFSEWIQVSPWWHKLLVLFPLLLIPVGGLLGALAGASAAAANQAVLRSRLGNGAKVTICIVIIAAAAIVYSVVAAILFAALHP